MHTSTVSKLDERDLSAARVTVQVDRLTNNDTAEVLEFLGQRPIHTVAMMSLIHDNGLVSPFNRGTFYGCRDANGQLEGVVLVGHATLMETVSDRALAALAARSTRTAGPRVGIGSLRRHRARRAGAARLRCHRPLGRDLAGAFAPFARRDPQCRSSARRRVLHRRCPFAQRRRRSANRHRAAGTHRLQARLNLLDPHFVFRSFR